MTKSKVGAEPKKQRIRHAVTKSEGIHEGIHRDDEFCTIKDFEADNPGKAITIAYNWCIENKLININ